MKNPSSSICGVKNENKWRLQVFKMNLWTFLHEQSSHVCVCQVSFILLCSASSSTFIRVVHWTNHFGKLSFRWATIKNNIFSSRGERRKAATFCDQAHLGELLIPTRLICFTSWAIKSFSSRKALGRVAEMPKASFRIQGNVVKPL